eukprot:XP_011676502.1 PREDICTED: uncharacterized protein LOC105444238 [Strongylocentrotus purpuratus]
MAVIIVMKSRRRYYKSSNLETIEDCSDSTDRNFSTHAIHLNHEYESTIPIVQTSISTEVENNALAYPSSFLPLTDTSPSSHDYEEVSTNMQEDIDPDGYTLPNVRGVDTEGYVVMVSNVKDDDAHGYTVPNVTFNNVSRTTSIDKTDENGYLVPNGAGYEPSDNKCEAADESMFVDNILYVSSDAVTMTMKGKQGQNADEANLYFVLEKDNLYSTPPPFDSHLEEDSDAGPSGHQYEDIDSTRKLVEGGARCSTHLYAMPDDLSKTTDSRMNACGKGYPLDTINDVNDTSPASMVSESTVDVGPLYAQID